MSERKRVHNTQGIIMNDLDVGSYVEFIAPVDHEVDGGTIVHVPKGTRAVVIERSRKSALDSSISRNDQSLFYVVRIPKFNKGIDFLFITVRESINQIEKPDDFAELPDSQNRELDALAGEEERSVCLACNQTFQDGLSHCPKDGGPLIRYGRDENLKRILQDENGEKFQLVERLAQGKLAAVYKARRLSSSDLVVVKFPSAPWEDNAKTAYQTVWSEAKLLSTINHPSIVKFISKGANPESCFFVMEYLAAPLISIVIDSYSQADTMLMAESIADALLYLHSRGLVHPRLSSADIAAAGDGAPAKLIDFGESRVIGHANGTYSRNGIFGGDFSEMAPEIIIGKPETPASNVYSLASIIFHCLAGRKLFVRDKHNSFIQATKIFGEPAPKLSQVARNVVLLPGIENMLERCLSKEPGKRPSSAEFNDVLRSLRQQQCSNP